MAYKLHKIIAISSTIYKYIRYACIYVSWLKQFDLKVLKGNCSVKKILQIRWKYFFSNQDSTSGYSLVINSFVIAYRIWKLK